MDQKSKLAKVRSILTNELGYRPVIGHSKNEHLGSVGDDKQGILMLYSMNGKYS